MAIPCCVSAFRGEDKRREKTGRRASNILIRTPCDTKTFARLLLIVMENAIEFSKDLSQKI